MGICRQKWAEFLPNLHHNKLLVMCISLYYLLLKLINNVGWQDNICQHHKQCIMMKIRKKFGSFLPTNAQLKKKIIKKGVTIQANFPVGIRHLRGVEIRSGLSGEAPRGDSTPSKLFLEFGLFNWGMPRSTCLSIWEFTLLMARVELTELQCILERPKEKEMIWFSKIHESKIKSKPLIPS